MGITYTLEEEGNKHVITVKSEDWLYSSYGDMEKVMKWLCLHSIPCAVEVVDTFFHIQLEYARWEMTTPEIGSLDDSDEHMLDILKQLITWKIKGTRLHPPVPTASDLYSMPAAVTLGGRK